MEANYLQYCRGFCHTLTRISHGCTCVLEKAVAPHSTTLAWKIPWTEEPGRLQSMWSLRVRHDWVTSLWNFTFMHWRRKWQPTPVFLPGESQGRWSLLGCWSMGSHRVGHDLSDLAAAAARHSELRVFQKNWFCSYQEWSRSCGQEPWTQWGWKDLRWY